MDSKLHCHTVQQEASHLVVSCESALANEKVGCAAVEQKNQGFGSSPLAVQRRMLEMLFFSTLRGRARHRDLHDLADGLHLGMVEVHDDVDCLSAVKLP